MSVVEAIPSQPELPTHPEPSENFDLAATPDRDKPELSDAVLPAAGKPDHLRDSEAAITEPKSEENEPVADGIEEEEAPQKRHWFRIFLPIFLLVAIVTELFIMRWMNESLTKPQTITAPPQLVNPS